MIIMLERVKEDVIKKMIFTDCKRNRTVGDDRHARRNVWYDQVMEIRAVLLRHGHDSEDCDEMGLYIRWRLYKKPGVKWSEI